MENELTQGAANQLTLGLFHGPKEEIARLFMWTTVAEATCLMAFPWILSWYVKLHHATRAYRSILPSSPTMLLFLDLLGALLLYSYISIYGRLTTKIAEGSEDRLFLDSIRYSVVAMGQSFIVLVALVATHI